jgi:hypothetical protein
LAPILKAVRPDLLRWNDRNPITDIVENGETTTVETPGLPGLLAFACAEVVFDSLNEKGDAAKWRTNWTARVAQALDKRSVPLSMGEFPPDLAPATKRTRENKAMRLQQITGRPEAGALELGKPGSQWVVQR